MSIEIWSKTENISAQGNKNSILLTEVLFHSSGCGSISEGAKPSYLTDLEALHILGLSNEVSFDFELYWKGCKKKLNCLTENQLYGITWPPVYNKKSTFKLPFFMHFICRKTRSLGVDFSFLQIRFGVSKSIVGYMEKNVSSQFLADFHHCFVKSSSLNVI